jgi:hypothetical protein
VTENTAEPVTRIAVASQPPGVVPVGLDICIAAAASVTAPPPTRRVPAPHVAVEVPETTPAPPPDAPLAGVPVTTVIVDTPDSPVGPVAPVGPAGPVAPCGP